MMTLHYKLLYSLLIVFRKIVWLASLSYSLEQGIIKLTQTNSLLQTLQNIQTKYNPKTTNVGIIAQGLLGKITKYRKQ